jgi:hypothetical protein
MSEPLRFETIGENYRAAGKSTSNEKGPRFRTGPFSI